MSIFSFSPDEAVHLTSQFAREVARGTSKFLPDGTGQSTTAPAHDAADVEDDCIIALALNVDCDYSVAVRVKLPENVLSY